MQQLMIPCWADAPRLAGLMRPSLADRQRGLRGAAQELVTTIISDLLLDDVADEAVIEDNAGEFNFMFDLQAKEKARLIRQLLLGQAAQNMTKYMLSENYEKRTV